MSILTKLGLGPKDAADAVMDVAERGADIVERWKPSDKAKHEMAREDLGDQRTGTSEARAYDPRTETKFTGMLGGISEMINVVVDAINRMIRPTVAVLLIGATFGVWDLHVETRDPVVLGWTEAIVGFYFGVRTVVYDIPKLLKALKSIREDRREADRED